MPRTEKVTSPAKRVAGFIATFGPAIAKPTREVTLHFPYGAPLPDPDGVLEGGGTQGRFIRLANQRPRRA